MTDAGGTPKARRRHGQVKEGRLGRADLDRLAIHLFLHRWERAIGVPTSRIDSHSFRSESTPPPWSGERRKARPCRPGSIGHTFVSPSVGTRHRRTNFAD